MQENFSHFFLPGKDSFSKNPISLEGEFLVLYTKILGTDVLAYVFFEKEPYS